MNPGGTANMSTVRVAFAIPPVSENDDARISANERITSARSTRQHPRHVINTRKSLEHNDFSTHIVTDHCRTSAEVHLSDSSRLRGV